MKKSVRKNSRIGLDTNTFIYFFEPLSPFHATADQLFTEIAKTQSQIISSVITLSELLSFAAPMEALSKLELNFFSIPVLQILDVNAEIAKEAARIRRTYKFLLADSIQLATCLSANVDFFLTNDRKLKAFKELPVELLKK